MSRLHILGLPVGWTPPNYRGVDRPGPTPVAPEKAPAAARAFWWFTRVVREDQSIDDLVMAEELVRAYGAMSPPEPLQVVEVTAPNEDPRDGRALGYDLAAGMYSLLSWDLELGRPARQPLPDDDPDHALRPVLRVVGNYFRSLLGPHGLFTTPVVATECLEALLAAQELRPQLWGHPSDIFTVVRVVALVNPDL